MWTRDFYPPEFRIWPWQINLTPDLSTTLEVLFIQDLGELSNTLGKRQVHFCLNADDSAILWYFASTIVYNTFNSEKQPIKMICHTRKNISGQTFIFIFLKIGLSGLIPFFQSLCTNFYLSTLTSFKPNLSLLLSLLDNIKQTRVKE